MKLTNGKKLLLTKEEPEEKVEYGELPLLPTARRVYAKTIAQDLVSLTPTPNYREERVFRDDSRREFFNKLQRNQKKIRRTMYGSDR